MDTNRLSFEVISKIGDIYESMGVSDSNIVSGIKLLNKDKIIYYSTSYCQLM